MRTAAELAEFDAEVARQTAERLTAAAIPTLNTDRGHDCRGAYDRGYLYHGRGAVPTTSGVRVRTRNRRGRVVLIDMLTEAEVASFGTAVRFWAARPAN